MSSRLTKESQALLRRQIEAKLQGAKKTTLPQPPRKGWIQAIRTALGMSVAQLANRLSMTDSGVRKLESSEYQRTITLQTLDKVAEAMDCQVYYVLIPNDTLENSRRKQAYQVAAAQLQKVAHSMSLESQCVSSDETAHQIEQEVKRLLTDESRKLWQSH